MSETNIIQERLRLLRSQSGKNQDIVAEECGISRIALARYEGGARVPQASILAKLAAYYNVSVDYLMGREETVENSSPPADPVTTEGLELLSQLNEDQLDSAIEYMRFLLSQKKK